MLTDNIIIYINILEIFNNMKCFYTLHVNSKLQMKTLMAKYLKNLILSKFYTINSDMKENESHAIYLCIIHNVIVQNSF